jgi:hypothetical protein
MRKTIFITLVLLCTALALQAVEISYSSSASAAINSIDPE